MSKPRNVLWIMADQLRWDYLSCYGHPTLKTPHLDGLAARGVRFDRAYIQSPFCGPSRMSYYTGRYVRSHGSTWNGFPLRVGEPTLGDHLREVGVNSVIVGKTHMEPDTKGMEWLGIDPESTIGVRVSECGFDPFERHDGLYAGEPILNYNDYLHAQGYNAPNPWHDWANSAEDEDGEILSGWLLENANRPARVPEEHSETPYITRRAIDFIESAGEGPWLCHLSYIKPHWPFIAPAPYHDMYGPDDVLPAVRSEAEKATDHPVFKAYIESRICRSFARDKVRERIIPAYMGLIKQMDDQLGLLFDYLEKKGLFENTMIVMSSDHGDYLGDHWMGEKDLFHEPSVRVPLIVYDPRPHADATRGTASADLVEGIDLAPTFMEFFGAEEKPHIIEGRSLAPILHGHKDFGWREFVISEYDYSTRPARLALGIDQADARLIMIRNDRWKYVHFAGYRPILFDLENDPDELNDLGKSDEHEPIRQQMRNRLLEWASRHHTRITKTPAEVDAMAGKEPPGFLIGFWDEEELAAEGLRVI